MKGLYGKVLLLIEIFSIFLVMSNLIKVVRHFTTYICIFSSVIHKLVYDRHDRQKEFRSSSSSRTIQILHSKNKNNLSREMSIRKVADSSVQPVIIFIQNNRLFMIYLLYMNKITESLDSLFDHYFSLTIRRESVFKI